MKSLLASAALLLSAAVALPSYAADAAAPAKPDLAKGQEKASQLCVACHSFDGTRGIPANPIIAGQHFDYLVKQLHEFKSGKRNNAVMAGMAGPLTEQEIRDVAAFYASKTAKTGFSSNKDTLTLGEKIYRGGITSKQVPACSGCHSPNGAGIPAQYPRLGSQHAAYTESQLNAFRAGTRGNSTQMLMISARMSDKEIKAVSDYIAGLR